MGLNEIDAPVKRSRLTERVRHISDSAPLKIAARAGALRKEGKPIVSLSTGEPDFDTPEHIKAAGIRAINENHTRYTPAEGTVELRQAIVEKLRRENNIHTSIDRVQVSSGGKHALSNAVLTIAERGDEVLVQRPYWSSYPAMVHIAEATPVFIDTTAETDWKITPDQLSNAISPRTRMMILNTPVNPTSTFYTEAELRAFVPIIKESGMIVVVDELYEKLLYDDAKHFSLGSLPELENQIITVNGVSKAYAMTGWRLGYSAGPKDIISAMYKLQSQAVSHPSSITQRAALEAITGEQESVEAMRQAFERRRDIVLEELAKMPELRHTRPTAAFYSFFDVSDFLGLTTPSGKPINDSEDLCDYLLEEKFIALIPGTAFGVDDHVRLSFAASEADIREGISRLRNGLSELRS